MATEINIAKQEQGKFSFEFSAGEVVFHRISINFSIARINDSAVCGEDKNM